jgi:NADH dehydrogenase FAD-containing subunit
MNYFAWHLSQTLLCFNANKKKDIVLLGDGFFARGFLHTIDHNRFTITQIYKDKFINPQMIITDTPSFHIRNLFKPTVNEIRMTIKSLDLSSSSVVRVNGQSFKYDHLVIGLGAQKSLADWKQDIKNFKYSPTLHIVGMGPTGIELATIYASQPGTKIHLYDTLPKDKVLSYLKPEHKNLIMNTLTQLNIDTHYETRYQGTGGILCVGTQPNNLTSGYKIDAHLKLKEEEGSVYMGGDCGNTGFVKSGQVAYQQGVYVAKKLNGAIGPDEPFVYKHNGMAINIGNNKVLVEGHRVIPDGVYPTLIIKIYSLFFV